MAADGDTRAQAAEATDDPYVAAHGGAGQRVHLGDDRAAQSAAASAHEAERDWQVDWLAVANLTLAVCADVAELDL